MCTVIDPFGFCPDGVLGRLNHRIEVPPQVCYPLSQKRDFHPQMLPRLRSRTTSSLEVVYAHFLDSEDSLPD